MTKSRHNVHNKSFRLDSMCLDCGTKGITKKSNYKHGLYDIDDLICPICLITTKHVICKNIDELKAQLQYKIDITELDQMILDIMNNKVKTK